MAADDLVSGGNLGSEFNIDTVNQEIVLRLGNRLSKDAGGNINVTVGLQTTTQTVSVGHASGSQANGTTIQARRCTITRTAQGRYTVAFAAAHPDGANYEVVFGQEEPGNTRDVPKVSVVTGSRTANGFDLQVTIDDNGGGADNYQDDTFSFEVLRDLSVLTDVQLI